MQQQFGGTTFCIYLHVLQGNKQTTQNIANSILIDSHQSSKLNKGYYFIEKKQNTDQLCLVLPNRKIIWAGYFLNNLLVQEQVYSNLLHNASHRIYSNIMDIGITNQPAPQRNQQQK